MDSGHIPLASRTRWNLLVTLPLSPLTRHASTNGEPNWPSHPLRHVRHGREAGDDAVGIQSL